MRKIRLDLEALAVESFPTGDDDAERGTVYARESLRLCSAGPYTCVGEGTCVGELTCGCGCSQTDGVAVCKSCGPSCIEP